MAYPAPPAHILTANTKASVHAVKIDQTVILAFDINMCELTKNKIV